MPQATAAEDKLNNFEVDVLKLGEKKEIKKFFVFGIDLSHSHDVIQLVICSCGVFFFYLIYGYMQVS